MSDESSLKPKSVKSTLASIGDCGSWPELRQSYLYLINCDSDADSKYLRDEGLKKTIIQMIGHPEGQILDVGCGDGWLSDCFPHNVILCDISRENKQVDKEILLEDVRSLSFEDESFEIINASLLLMWFDDRDLKTVCRELYRVATRPGRLIVALRSPCFYQTGKINKSGDFVVQKNLGVKEKMSIMIGGKVGPVEYFRRSLCEYFHVLTIAGWNVRQIREWFLDLDHYRHNVDGVDNLPRTDKVPIYTFFECLKT